ncbi:hypothetical protein [Paraburkholderia sp. J8-2]|uniref:hypothetical protein n=1 Tax=Paraburkholderia sp. J8-2 TaxID=2805440 RepID=UPI002AB7C7F5|nr:hypothetical protein [Paraburkholderia sp. J8-2]
MTDRRNHRIIAGGTQDRDGHTVQIAKEHFEQRARRIPLNVQQPSKFIQQVSIQPRLAPIALGAKLSFIPGLAGQPCAAATNNASSKASERGDCGVDADRGSVLPSALGASNADESSDSPTCEDAVPAAAREMDPWDPDLPEYAREFYDEEAIVPATARLVMFRLPGNEREFAVRVVERMACRATWYEIELRHEPGQWRNWGNAPKAELALRTVRECSWSMDDEEEQFAR